MFVENNARPRSPGTARPHSLNCSSTDPRQVNLANDGRLRLVFPRRAGLPAGLYRLESTADLTTWIPTLDITESVIARDTIGGVPMETIEALFPSLGAPFLFVRLAWAP